MRSKNSHVFFISNTFISYTSLELAKNQAKPKQHLDGELLLFETRFLHRRCHPKIKEFIQKNVRKKNVFLRDYMINCNEN